MEIEGVMAIGAIFIGLPWMVLHYMTKWKTAPTITADDEVLLEELYNLAKRLDERMDTVERLVATDDPAFTPARRMIADQERDNEQLRELEKLMLEKKGTRS
ncbi:envelope stress response membrane protein PspB [Porphyrobacter sp. AAP82]|uniref:envelope stress response membrane protein PspB n=1 Tax=Porphyrobacter sp. AAP82 TaxID=1248917 RepID=UPI0003107FA3|nr:envelope stress response membrane protein PspB [Porphyrobacter sp. AAP82]